MMIWWIRISVVKDERKEVPFFIGQEMLFSQFHEAIEQLGKENEGIKIRFELNQTKNQQPQAVGLFTWESKEQLNILDSIEMKLELGVKNNMLDKKRKKEIIKHLTMDVYKNPKKPSIKKVKSISRSYPPKNQFDVESEDSEIEPTLEANTPQSRLNEGVEDKGEDLPVKQPKIKKERLKKSGPSPLSLLLKKVQLAGNSLISFFEHKWKWLVASFMLLFLICSIVFVSVSFFQSKGTNEVNDSFSVLKSKKEYKEMADKYPAEFWKWEEKEVEEMATDTLMEVYEDYPDEAVAYDIAFLGKAYTKVIQMYKDAPEKLRMNDTRYAFLGFSYLKEDDLPTAEKMAAKSNSQALYGQLSLAYLRKGDDKKAEECNKIAQDDEINVQIKDYQLVKTTLDEVNKQLGNKNLSKEIRSKLLENKQVLEDELKKIKSGEDE
ncbi:hypothetical protein D3O27_14215 [Listeria monocytogenes]|uniref:hypothetical protein n=1 Tax=Listeria monocytogenes TaxID=1639 RepID=UPI0010EAB9EA|nr:hypothetical protein [Listeria monocytogenes]EAD2655762.1 hypothetical protein [Listeria monocytogenes]EAE1475567.1 hypothetical protein [Listeria monocytogenes]EIL9556953.1 hypothetical protein [Listeria monocytogenes]EIL9559938.1 hypothetical protein [Listeria monocytogenes]EIL9717142.1 hypothetical protein [Listeria monocytogenes]